MEESAWIDGAGKTLYFDYHGEKNISPCGEDPETEMPMEVENQPDQLPDTDGASAVDGGTSGEGSSSLALITSINGTKSLVSDRYSNNIEGKVVRYSTIFCYKNQKPIQVHCNYLF